MERQELEKLIEAHSSIPKIAKAKGVSQTTIRYWLREWGLKSKGSEGRKKARPLCKNCGAMVKRLERIYCSNRCQLKAARREKVEMNPDSVGIPRLKNYLLDCRGHVCEVCGISEWMGQPAPIELDHKDGNPTNNDLRNLRLICPNCHAQTKTYKGKNKGNGRYFRKERYAAGKSF
jgi:transposase-like protein